MYLANSMLLFSAALVCSGAESPAEPIEISDVLITVIERVEVPARERGLITELCAEEGDLVKAGQLLIQIDDADARLAMKRAAIELETARSQAANDVKLRLAKKALELAESEFARGRKSRELFKDSVTDEELQRRELAVDKAKLDIEQAQHERQLAELNAVFSENELAIAQRNVELRRIAAPIGGLVVQVNRRPGEWVEPGLTAIRILRTDRLRAEGFLDAKQLGEELVGREVTLTTKLAGGNEIEFTGVLRFVSPEINPVDGRVRVWAEIENRDMKLRPGMRGSLRIAERR